MSSKKSQRIKSEMENAVSPVVGTILMVAIVVILAAVVAAWAFGMSGNIQVTKVIGFSATKTDDNHISIMNMGGADTGSLTAITATTSPDAGTQSATGGLTVGSNAILTANTLDAYQNRQTVTVVGTFSDGSTQVLYQKTL